MKKYLNDKVRGLKMLKNIIKKTVKPKILKRNIKYLKSYYSEISQDEELKEDSLPFDENILVLSPHQDDESIGLGATIIKLKENNCYVKVLYITDGRIKRDGIDEIEISKTRLKEADEAIKILGVDDFEYIECENLKVEDNLDIISKKIVEVLSDRKYKRIYTTAFSEYHIDHRGCSIALARALDDKCDFDGEIFLYEINNSLQRGSINRYVQYPDDIAKIKHKAFKMYSSQKGISFEVVELIERGKSNLGDGNFKNAELFLCIDAEKFIEVSKKNLSIFNKMKNATNFFRMIENYNYNKSFEKEILNLYK
ncbi:LmbE family N-acetylglucosaminyl deacetylase [Peptostreptococcus canis]|nr:LmbE family N-acetylglucosaminyl deacetylase [Peptostreptococcus canis]